MLAFIIAMSLFVLHTRRKRTRIHVLSTRGLTVGNRVFSPGINHCVRANDLDNLTRRSTVRSRKDADIHAREVPARSCFVEGGPAADVLGAAKERICLVVEVDGGLVASRPMAAVGASGQRRSSASVVQRALSGENGLCWDAVL
jgi:hypothetical protein